MPAKARPPAPPYSPPPLRLPPSVPAHPSSRPSAAEALDTEKLLAARQLAVTACPYLAAALYALAIVPTYHVPTMAVDRFWRCYVSPGFVASTELRDLATVWLHEVAHLVRDHHRRARTLMDADWRRAEAGTAVFDHEHPDRERVRLNLAMDCEINDDLLDGLTGALPDSPWSPGPDATGPGLRLPPGAVTPAALKIKARELFEQYARDLVGVDLSRFEGWHDCGSGAHGDGGPWEQDGEGAQPLGEYEAAAIRIRVRDALNSGRGTAPAGWRRWAEGVGQPSQDWRTLLGGAFRACLAAGSGAGDYSYRRPGRRTPALGGAVVLPSLRRPLPRVAVVVDTSGSVSDADLGSALSEVIGISRAVGVQHNRIALYSCDAAVHTVQQVCDTGDVALIGGGGTDLRRGINRAVSGSPRPDVVVVLTDGYTPWPEAAPGSRVIAGLFGRPHRYSEDADPDAYAARRSRQPPDWVRTVYLR